MLQPSAHREVGHQLIIAESGDHAWGKWEVERKAESKQPWYSLVDPPPKDSEWWASFPKIAKYDPAQYWSKVHVPVLVVEAGDDLDVPVERSIVAIRDALLKGGNPDYTVLVLPDAPHTFVVHSKPGQPFHWPYLYHGYADLLVAWVRYRTVDRPLPS